MKILLQNPKKYEKFNRKHGGTGVKKTVFILVNKVGTVFVTQNLHISQHHKKCDIRVLYNNSNRLLAHFFKKYNLHVIVLI